MFKKHSIFITAILVLTIFSSCGFIKIDFRTAAEQFTDFSPKESLEESYEDSNDCGCYGPKSPGPCTYIGFSVCGCDGITYGNPCVARRNGIYHYTIGKCQLTMNLIFFIE